MSTDSKKALLLDLIKHTVDLNLLEKQQKPLFVVSFVGLTGVGKSTVAHILKQKSELPLFSHDDIRAFLYEKGEDHDNRELIEWLSLERATYLLKEGVCFILDGDVVSYYQILEKRLVQLCGHLLLINVICDLNIVMERLNKRQFGEKQFIGNVNFSSADFNTYFQRRFLHTQGNYPDKFFALVNNSHDSEGQVAEK
jgi:adenylylsulfate kinase-like enzyme